MAWTTPNLWRADITLLPFIEKRKIAEVKRAANARKHKKIRGIPVRYPSVNTMYPFSKRTGRKYLSGEGEMYKEYIDEELTKQFDGIPDWDKFEVSYVFYMTDEMMFKKNGDLSEHDVSNFLKATEDALFDWLLESDGTVMSVHGHKRLTVNDPRIVILISPAIEVGTIHHQGIAFDPYDLEVESEEAVRWNI